MKTLSFQEKVLYGELIVVIAAVIFYVHFLRVAPPGHIRSTASSFSSHC